VIWQEVDGLRLQLKAAHDLSWLGDLGRVFCVFDQLISGNLCFGVQDGERRLFVKYAGAQTALYAGHPQAAVQRLEEAAGRYRALRHPCLARLQGEVTLPQGLALVFEWFEGYALAPLEAQLDLTLGLPLVTRLAMYDGLMDLLVRASEADYLAAGLSRHHILVDTDSGRAMLSSLNHFLPFPATTPHPKLPGASWFLPEEAYQVGARLDDSANVYALGALAFLFFNAYKEKSAAGWTAGQPLLQLAQQACQPQPARRVPSAARFQAAWRQQVMNLPDLY